MFTISYIYVLIDKTYLSRIELYCKEGWLLNMVNAIGWFSFLEAEWIFSLVYLKTAIWLPKIYRSCEYWTGFDNKILAVNIIVSIILIVLSVLFTCIPGNYILTYYFLLAFGCIPILIITYSLIVISLTISSSEN